MFQVHPRLIANLPLYIGQGVLQAPLQLPLGSEHIIGPGREENNIKIPRRPTPNAEQIVPNRIAYKPCPDPSAAAGFLMNSCKNPTPQGIRQNDLRQSVVLRNQ